MTESSNLLINQPVIFWQANLSIHQTPLLEKFAETWKAPVFLVVDCESPQHRIENSGWTVARPQGVIVSMDGAEVPADAIHIVSGFAGTLQWKKNRNRVRKSKKSQIWVVAESLQTKQQPVKGLLRLARQGFFRVTLHKDLTGFLAIGELAATQARILGVSSAKIFPFCYVTSNKTSAAAIMASPISQYSVLYVGRISKPKGTDVLFRSINWGIIRLQLIGEISDPTLKIPAEAEYLGIRPNSEVSDYIRQADLLVLPSRYDGWGAVVNEALMVGTPVVCTDACGASSLIKNNFPYRGEVIRNLTVESLNDAIDTVLSSHPDSIAIADWASRSIGAGPVSSYLKALLMGEKVKAPWLAS